MGKDSGIQWTTHTFNGWVGCQRVSPGCENCYAESYDKRVGGAVINKETGEKSLRWGPKAPRVRTSAANWKKPIAWNKAAVEAGERHRVFCSSLADVFEQLVPGQVGDLDSWRLQLFELISKTPQLDWLLLTKRPPLITRGLSGAVDAWARTPGCEAGMELAQAWTNGTPPPNVWLGTTVEDQKRANERIPELLSVPAVVRFLSMEPLLEPVLITKAKGIDWVIIGGESGGCARPFHLEWARDLVAQCRFGGAAPFVKQMGSAPHMDGDRLRFKDHHGGDMAEWPPELRVREFPQSAAAQPATKGRGE